MNPIYKNALAEWKANPARSVYINLNDTAKLIRGVLKAKFPNTKFSVRGSKYAGGSSLRVNWMDGPTAGLVEAFINGFKGGSFDGMIDMAYSYDGWLYPDGSASLRGTGGTNGSGGSYEAWTAGPRGDGAIPVSYGGDFLFVEREVSFEAMKRVCEAYAAKYPSSEMGAAIKAGKVGVEKCDRFRDYKFFGNPQNYRDEIGDGSQYGGDCVLRAMAGRRILPSAIPVAA